MTVVMSAPMDVGGGIVLADVQSPSGEVFGVIFNPFLYDSIEGLKVELLIDIDDATS